MLHRINLPACTQHLEWVVQLQGDLLRALCGIGVAPAHVTVDWVKACRTDIDANWMERFCGWSKQDNAKVSKSVLVRMQAVAALPDADKQTLLTHYDTNLRYPESFKDAVPPPPATTPLPDGLSDNSVAAYREFFELFYDPIIYRAKGYPIAAPELNGKPFTKDQYLEAYHAANRNLKVCPLCDGTMDGAELDHWLAKKHLPELNCHPQNLVEICGACNSRTNKGERLALDVAQANPFDSWFHPYLRPATENFAVARQGERLRLVSDDGQSQTMLNNFGQLINLGTRWSREWATQIDRIQSKLRNSARRGHPLDEAEIREKIKNWLNDADAEIGLAAYAMLEKQVLSSALAHGSDAFAELVAYAQAQPAA